MYLYFCIEKDSERKTNLVPYLGLYTGIQMFQSLGSMDI